jgi:hypothetical protein
MLVSRPIGIQARNLAIGGWVLRVSAASYFIY